MKALNHPTGQGRLYKKDIDYTTCGPRVKDSGLAKDNCPTTSGMEAVTGTPRPKHDFTVKGVK